jgi:hypothetical protein
LLAGEKQGRDMLEIEDYVDAADRLSARMREVAVRLSSASCSCSPRASR